VKSDPAAEKARSAGIGALYAALWRFAAGARLQALAAAGLLLAAQLVRLLSPWLAAQALNSLQAAGSHASGPGLGPGLGHTLLLILAIVLNTALAWGLHVPGRILERSVGIRVRGALADRLYFRAVNLPLAWHEQHHSGQTLHRLQKTSGALFDFAQNQYVYIQSSVNLAGPIGALFLISAPLGAIALVSIGLSALVVLFFDAALGRLARAENAAERHYAARLGDFLGSVSTLISLRLQQATRRLAGERLAAVFAPLSRAITLNEAKWCTVDLLTVLVSWALVALYAWQAHQADRALLIGNVFMVYQYAVQAGAVMGSVAAHYQQYARILADFSSADPIWQAPRRRHAGPRLPAAWREIRLENVSLRYPGSAEGGIADVALVLRRGARIALVGPSGSGKSTLMRVLSGLYPADRMQLTVDGRAYLRARSLESLSTLIPQSAVVFQGSVRENLTCGAACPQAAVDTALRVSQFDAVLADLKQGLETSIAEDGLNLSGGQRQRLSLARGILAARDSSIICLDEPTSSLDALTEAQVFDALEAAFPDACLVAAVHRMSLLDRFDRVVLLAGGRIVDTGTAAELRARQPLFEALWQGGASRPEGAERTGPST
jgi:ABC-type multidrug transport system fused ATPase/permease subunit